MFTSAVSEPRLLHAGVPDARTPGQEDGILDGDNFLLESHCDPGTAGEQTLNQAGLRARVARTFDEDTLPR